MICTQSSTTSSNGSKSKNPLLNEATDFAKVIATLDKTQYAQKINAKFQDSKNEAESMAAVLHRLLRTSAGMSMDEAFSISNPHDLHGWEILSYIIDLDMNQDMMFIMYHTVANTIEEEKCKVSIKDGIYQADASNELGIFGDPYRIIIEDPEKNLKYAKSQADSCSTDEEKLKLLKQGILGFLIRRFEAAWHKNPIHRGLNLNQKELIRIFEAIQTSGPNQPKQINFNFNKPLPSPSEFFKSPRVNLDGRTGRVGV